MPFVNDENETGKPMTIDRERDIVLMVASRGDPDGMVSFFLDWHGERIYLEGIDEGENSFQDENGKWKFDLEWKISRIDVPEGFPETNEAVFQVITEAFEKRGERDRANIVTVKKEREPKRYTGEPPWKGYFEPKGLQLDPEWIKDRYGDEA